MKQQKQPKTAEKETVSRSQRGVYMDDRAWEAADRKAKTDDRSVNYVIEKALIYYFDIKQ